MCLSIHYVVFVSFFSFAKTSFSNEIDRVFAIKMPLHYQKHQSCAQNNARHVSENELSEISTQHLATSRRLNRLYHHRWLHAFEVCIFRFRAIRMDEIPLFWWLNLRPRSEILAPIVRINRLKSGRGSSDHFIRGGYMSRGSIRAGRR